MGGDKRNHGMWPTGCTSRQLIRTQPAEEDMTALVWERGEGTRGAVFRAGPGRTPMSCGGATPEGWGPRETAHQGKRNEI